MYVFDIFCQSPEILFVLSRCWGHNTMFLEGFDSKADYALTLFGNTVILFHPNGKQQQKKKDYLLGPLSIFPLIFLLLCALFIITKMLIYSLIGSPLQLWAQCACIKTPTHKVFGSWVRFSRCFIGLLLSAKPDSVLPQALIFWLLILNDNCNVKHILEKEEKR